MFLNLAIVLGGLHAMVTEGGGGGGWGGIFPYMANTGMCRWTEHCKRIESRYTRHKLAITKINLISRNRNIHPYIIRIRTPGKFQHSFLIL